MELKDWIAKWSKPYWMEIDPKERIRNITPEHYGQINLLWAMVGRPEITQGFFDNNLDTWALSGRICIRKIGEANVRDYATLLSEKEFYKLVQKHPQIFSSYMPMSRWNHIFKVCRNA